MDFTISSSMQNFGSVQPAQNRAGVPSKAEPVAPAPADSVSFSSEGLRFASFLEKAKQVPEVREDLVASFSAQVRSGAYPPPSIIDGIVNLIGAQLKA